MGGFIPTCQAQTFVELAKLENDMSFFEKKIPSLAEVKWRQAHQDARWEIRSEYLDEFFSKVSTMLPSQIAHLKEVNTSPSP